MPRTAALTLAALLALGGAAAAQAPAAQAPAAPGTAAPAAPSAAALAQARDVVLLSGLARNFESLIPQYMIQARDGLVRMRVELAGDIDEAIQALDRDPRAFEANRDEIVEIAARYYAERMTEGELRDTIAYFRTPSGRKYLDVQPAVIDDVFGQMQVWTTRLSAAITEKVRAELRKKGKDF